MVKYHIHVGLEDIAIRDDQDNDVCVCWDEAFAEHICKLLNTHNFVNRNIVKLLDRLIDGENTNEQPN